MWNGLDQQVIFQISLSVLSFLTYFLARKITQRIVVKTGVKYDFQRPRVEKMEKLMSLIWVLILIVFLAAVWGYDFKTIYIAGSSIFAMLGVAFFAVWSILSNITTSLIIYFRFPLRIGSKVSLPEIESVNGLVEDITLFHIILRTETGSRLAIPNNILIQKVIQIDEV